LQLVEEVFGARAHVEFEDALSPQEEVVDLFLNLRAERVVKILLRDVAGLEQDAAEKRLSLLLILKGLAQLGGCQRALADENFTDPESFTRSVRKKADLALRKENELLGLSP
jgi:hypothetical protein